MSQQIATVADWQDSYKQCLRNLRSLRSPKRKFCKDLTPTVAYIRYLSEQRYWRSMMNACLAHLPEGSFSWDATRRAEA